MSRFFVTFSRWLSVVYLLSHTVQAQEEGEEEDDFYKRKRLESTYEIRGYAAPSTEEPRADAGNAYSKCFNGMGFGTCTTPIDPELGREEDFEWATWNWASYLPPGQPYCVECCNNMVSVDGKSRMSRWQIAIVSRPCCSAPPASLQVLKMV